MKVGYSNGKPYDIETGELLKVPRGQNFLKLHLPGLIDVLETVGGKKGKVMIYIFKNLHLSDNTLRKTQREIAKACGVSLKTVNDTIQGLCERKILKGRSGSYMVSPNLFYRGKEDRKIQLQIQFNSFENNNL